MIGVTALASLTLTIAAGPAPEPAPAVSYLEGIVSFDEGGALDWRAVRIGQEVRAGDRYVLQQDSRLELDLQAGNVLRLGSGTDLIIRRLGPGEAEVELLRGVAILSLKGKARLQVDLHDLQVQAWGPGLYRLERESSWRRVVVRGGAAELREGELRSRLISGESLRILGPGELGRPPSVVYVKDPLDFWSDGRDAAGAANPGFWTAHSESILVVPDLEFLWWPYLLLEGPEPSPPSQSPGMSQPEERP